MTVIFTFARCNPMTTGHGKLFKLMNDLAVKQDGDALVFLSQSVNSDADFRKAAKFPEEKSGILRNPLTWEQKVDFLSQMYASRYPNLTIVDNKEFKTPNSFLLDWLNTQYDKALWISGEDRIPGYQSIVDGYYRISEDEPLPIEVISAGNRDPDATGIEGMSATKVRQAALDGGFDKFASAMDTDDMNLIKGIYEAVRTGMSLKKEKEPLNESVLEYVNPFILLGGIERHLGKLPHMVRSLLPEMLRKHTYSEIVQYLMKSLGREEPEINEALSNSLNGT